MANNSKYTYVAMANEVISVLNGETAITPELVARATEKLNALIATQTAKSAYNAANPKKTAPKGASEQTKANGELIGSVLGASPETAKTASEINAELGTDFTALQVANAMKFLDGAVSVKVIRETVNAKGLKSQKEYTAYYRG